MRRRTAFLMSGETSVEFEDQEQIKGIWTMRK
jgi:hypothetical protein